MDAPLRQRMCAARRPDKGLQRAMRCAQTEQNGFPVVDAIQGGNDAPRQPAAAGSARGFKKADCPLVGERGLSAKLGGQTDSPCTDTTGTALDQPTGGALA